MMMKARVTGSAPPRQVSALPGNASEAYQAAMLPSFSERHGYRVADPEITIREDAPDDLRYAVAEIARRAGAGPHGIREVVCGVLFVRPNPGNWSAYPNVWGEVQDLLSSCEWFKIYDIAEALWRSFYPDDQAQDLFQEELTDFSANAESAGELKDPDGIVFRGGEAFSAVTKQAVQVLAATGRTTASTEIHEALTDISRKPPDVTAPCSTRSRRSNALRAMSPAKPTRRSGRCYPSLICPSRSTRRWRSCGDLRQIMRGMSGRGTSSMTGRPS